jgi:hypothetical protein
MLKETEINACELFAWTPSRKFSLLKHVKFDLTKSKLEQKRRLLDNLPFPSEVKLKEINTLTSDNCGQHCNITLDAI